MSQRIFNFNPGPAVLPPAVLEQAREELVNWNGSGMSVMEMSHRSKEFEGILARAEHRLREVLGISDAYAVLFLQGGASQQFAMAPMNLARKGKPVDVLHTGAWTQKAIEEIKKVAECRLAASTEAEQFRRLPRKDELQFRPDASYVHLCSNNTIEGTQWRDPPNTRAIPLVADMSSDICSRPVDVSRFGLIFAGAQKNLGPAGVTVVIIRKDLAERGNEQIPLIFQYRTHIKHQSLYNTPPTYAIYIVQLVLEWIKAEGGLPALAHRNEEKARLLYEAIEASRLYYCPVAQADRSSMNVVFRITGDKDALEHAFAKEATVAGLVGLKGHRSVRGLRASIYNAHPIEGIQALVAFMREFERTHA